MSAIELLYRNAIDIQAKQITVVNAHAHPLLYELCRSAKHYHLLQHFKPAFDALTSSGLETVTRLASETDRELILIIPSKNRQQTLAWMAESMQRLADGGMVLMACANSYGAKGYESSLKKLSGNINSTSKSKCRIFSARKTTLFDAALADQWRSNVKPQRIESHGLISQPGLFSWDRPDPGSRLLLAHLPELSGTGMDLCCGYGLLSEEILRTSEHAKHLHLVEAEQLALECAAKNCEQWASQTDYHWLDAANEPLPGEVDWIVCNPPFHTGQERDIELGQKIIMNGCRSLKSGGEIYLVANRKLPYERILQSALKTVTISVQAEGFKVIRGVK